VTIGAKEAAMATPKGEDQNYLLTVQYKDGSNLASRIGLHAKYGTATENWYEWVASWVDWTNVRDVLEVGCGTGLLWPAINGVLPHPVGLTLTDLSNGMLSEARMRVARLPNVHLVDTEVADAQELPYPDASYDVIIANHMLYHVPDRPKAVAQLRRVLRPDGVLIAATNGLRHMQELMELRAAVLGGPAISEYTTRFGRENGAEILGASFGDIEWHDFPDELRCTDADDVVQYIASMAPLSIGAAQQSALRDAVVARMVDGVLTVTKDSGLFVARG
jgi:SAM-dependent methyltransferase